MRMSNGNLFTITTIKDLQGNPQVDSALESGELFFLTLASNQGTLLVGGTFFRRLAAALSILFFGGDDTAGVVSVKLTRDQIINLNDAIIEEVYHPNGEYVGEMHGPDWVDLEQAEYQ